MVSSWTENSPTATTCRSRGQAVLRAARKAAKKYADPASPKNPYASSSRVNPATVLTQNVIRDVQFWAHQAFHPATYHIIMTRSSRLGEKARPLSHAVCPSHHTSPGPITHHLAPSHITMARGRRTVAGTPPPTSVLRHSVTRRRAVQHLSNELVEHIRRHRSRPLMSRPSVSRRADRSLGTITLFDDGLGGSKAGDRHAER